MADKAGIDRHQPRDAFRFRQSRERHEMHHDAGRKPHREQQAERDAEPTMKQNERAHYAVMLPLG